MLSAFLPAIVLFTVAATTSSASDSPVRPNVVIFLVDDMGIMDTSLPFFTDETGKPVRYPLNNYYRTPNMERLAHQGIRFNQFNAMSVCSPSRVSILTGQNAARHRTTNWINGGGNNATPFGPPEWNWNGLKAGDVTLASVLQKNGYRTIHVGKAHFGPSSQAFPTELGFDVNIGGGAMGHPASYYSEDHYGGKLKNKQGKPHHNAVPHLEKYHDSGIFLTDALTQEANASVSQAVKDQKPFYLNLSHYAVHSPFHIDSRFAENYPVDPSFPNSHKFATLIEGMDQSLGQVLDHLDSLGVAENTLVFFLGDNGSDAPRKDEHGISSSAPLRGKKGTHYEGGMRIPFIAAWAKRDDNNPLQKKLGIPADAIQSQVASICDIFPTVLDITGAKNPEGHPVDGAPLEVLLTGKPDASRPETFLMHYPHQHRSVHFTSYRDGDWKVIYHYRPNELSGNSHYQLFNLKDDPAEQNDLSKSNPEELRRQMKKLVKQLKEYDALYPLDADKTGNPTEPIIP